MKYPLLFVSIASVLLAACSSSTTNTAEQPETRALTWSEEIAQPATLMHNLADNTLFYARVPSLTAFFTAPKPNAMGQLLTDSANEEAVRQLLTSARTELEAFGPMGVMAGLFMERQRSPLEIAVQVPPGAAFTAAQTSLSVRLDFENVAVFQQRLEEIAAQEPMLRIQSPATEEAPGLLNLGVMPAYYQYDNAQKRLTLVAGFSASADALGLIGSQANDEHPALLRQAEIDDSGYGVYIWADTASIIPMARPFIPAPQLQELEVSGLLDTQEVAYGMGTASGRGQTSFFARGTQGNIWELGLPASPSSSIQTLGQPSVFFSMAVPDSNWLERVMQTADADLGEWDALLEPHQLSMTAIMNGVAGRVSLVKDESGAYNALEPRNPVAFENLISQLAVNGILNLNEKNYGDHIIQHWHVPTAQLLDMDELGMPLFARSQNTNLWVMRQGDTWFMASVPQILMARLDHEANFEVEPWLESVGQSSKGRSMVVLGTFEQLVQTNYHYYLQGVQVFGEMLGADVDLMSFPPAYSAAIPATSTVSFSASYQESSMRLVYNYENHPLDPVQGSMTGVAVVGILAAVAIPAYEDYVARTEAALEY